MPRFASTSQPGPVTVILRIGSGTPTPAPGSPSAPAPPAAPGTPGAVPAATPAVAVPAAHRPLALTGAPVIMELSASLGLLLAGAVSAWAATRRRHQPRPAR